ncbi:hypothetical protein [Paenibacillus sp. NPDC055715]
MKTVLTVTGLLAFSIPYACQGLSPRVISISLLILLFSYLMLLPSLKPLIATLADNPLLTLLMMYIAASCLWADQEQTSSMLMVLNLLLFPPSDFIWLPIIRRRTASACWSLR